MRHFFILLGQDIAPHGNGPHASECVHSLGRSRHQVTLILAALGCLGLITRSCAILFCMAV